MEEIEELQKNFSAEKQAYLLDKIDALAEKHECALTSNEISVMRLKIQTADMGDVLKTIKNKIENYKKDLNV